jgi:hypothetical protein
VKATNDCLKAADNILNVSSDSLNTADDILNVSSDSLNTADDILNESSDSLNTADDILNESSDCLNAAGDLLNVSGDSLKKRRNFTAEVMRYIFERGESYRSAPLPQNTFPYLILLWRSRCCGRTYIVF